MESLVHSYLSKFFEIKTNEEANSKISWLVYDGIYSKNYDGYRNVIKAGALIKELMVIFFIDSYKAMVYITKWSELEKENIDLTHYWKHS